MNPAFLDSMSWEMAEVYGAITDQLIINLARHFPFYVAEQQVPTSAFTYQSAMLAQMGQISKETVQIIRNNLDGAEKALKTMLEQAIVDAVTSAEPDLRQAALAGVFSPATIPVVVPEQMRAFQLYYQQAAQKLNLVNTVMLESTKSAYQQAITDVVSDIELADRLNRTQIALDAAAGETITGVSSWNQALRNATEKLKNGGIIGFIDHAGHQWSAESYVAMDIRTTVFNTGRSAVWEVNEDFGNDLYLVSYHNGARPLCYPYQNKVISSTDNVRDVYDLDGNKVEVIAQSATSYGEPAGLFGINCRHYPTPFIPGVSVIDGQPQDKDTNARVYAESQQQRGLERKLREEKRDVMIAKAQGRPPEEIARLQDKTKATSNDIDEFCKSTGRARHRDREAVYTKREFPDADKYDVSAFERDQKDFIDEYYRKGGAQQGYTFGQMTPKEPYVPEFANVAQQTTTAAVQKSTIAGHTEKLKASMRPEEYREAVSMIDESEAQKLYTKYGDACHAIKRKAHDGYYYGDEVSYDFETHPGMNKFSTLAHEMGHMFDAHIGRDATLTFNEADVINSKCKIGSGVVKLIKQVPSTSDAFLSAIRKDKIYLKQILDEFNNTKFTKETADIYKNLEIVKMRAGSWRNSTAGIQDAMDGFFHTRDKDILPWGHGNRYYNRQYNNFVKTFDLEETLIDAYNELGFGKMTKAALKEQFRDYETASELWANVVCAITCGGDELKAFEQYMPETLKTALEIIRGL